jgi:hypothetical protein
MFITALFPIAKLWDQLRCPSTDEWIKKMWCKEVLNYVIFRKIDETGDFMLK